MKNAFHFLENDLNLRYGDKIVVAVSGGPDSMALLHLLIKLSKSLELEVICAHVNHNIRLESEKESKFIEKYCASEGIIFEKIVIEKYSDNNFQAEARNKRYEFFSNIVKKYNSKYLFTAHHADDLIETILMRIIRGSSLKGLAGFTEIVKKDKYMIVRPLIHVTKKEIINYNKENKLKYMHDKTNDEDLYTRNRIRKYVVPTLKKEDKNVHKKFYQFSKMLLEYEEYVDKKVVKVFKRIYHEGSLSVVEFKREEKLIQKRILHKIFEKLYQNDLLDISSKHLDIVHYLVTSSKSKVTIHLPNQITVNKEYDFVYFSKNSKTTIEYEYRFAGHLNLPNGKNIIELDNEESDGNDVCRLNSKDLKLPLYVRTRRDGDKMTIKGMLGRKKINDIFTDEKISDDMRNHWPIVVDSNGEVVWLPGLKKTTFNKTKDQKYDIILKYY